MRPRLSYVAGYGWHAGRLLLWPVLLFGSLLSIFPMAALDLFLSAVTRFRGPYGLLIPAIFAVIAARRVKRKLAGEPFVVDPLFDDEYELDFVHRSAEPERFARLLRLEVLAWGGAIAIQVVLELIWFWRFATGG